MIRGLLRLERVSCSNTRARACARGSRLRVAVLTAFALAAALPARAAAPAGAPIDNTATGAAVIAGGATVSLPSNTVRVVVQPSEGVALFPDRGGQAAPGAGVTLAHRLVNTGNVTTDYRLDALNLALDGFDAASLALVEDRNHDGIAGPGDTPIANGGILTLAAGDSADVLLTLGVPANAPFGAQALARLSATGLAQGANASVTDTLRTPPLGFQPALLFFDAGDYLRPTKVAGLGAPLEVEAVARGCDSDPARIETVRITLRSRDTGDQETRDAIETGPHSGLFRFVPGEPTVNGARTSSSGDGVLSVVRGDLVTAELAGCGGTLTRSTVWIEPSGLVYGSRSDNPVGGVRVRLIDVSGAGNGGAPGGLASVLSGDGVTPSPAEVTTDALGRFSFPLVRRSSYRLDVVAPEPYRFPSRVGSAALPAGHFTDPAGSWGGRFTTPDSLGPVLVDVPVDEVGTIALFVEQTASRPEVEWGDELDYTVQVANQSDSTLDSVTVREQLPPGFGYTHGTARGGLVNGIVTAAGGTLPDPAGSGPSLAFPIGTLGPHESFLLRLRAHVGSGAPTGEALALAAAEAGEVRSNPAPVRVLVRGDIFADEGGIVGVVRLRTAGTSGSAADGVGLAGVRLYLDDGTWAVTDGQGRFSFTGITPTTHALKLDRTTLPPRAFPVSVDHRDLGTPGLRFVDLTRGELVHAEFAVEGDTSALEDVLERRTAAARRDEATRALARAIEVPEQRAHTEDLRTLPASAIVTGEHETGEGGARGTRPASVPAGIPGAASAVIALEQLLPTLDPELGFVGIADLDTMPGTQIAVRVKGQLGTDLALRVNGERVPESRVGRRVTAAAAGLEAWEYLGVTLKPGLNVLELAPPHAAGRVAVRLVAPAALAALELVGPRVAPADGRSPAVFMLSLADSTGVPVGARTLVTLESTLGRFGNADLDAGTPGVQVAVEGGHARVELYPSATPGHAQVTAATGALRAAAEVEFLPEMRPLLAVGMFEGVVTRDGVHGTPRDAGFQQPIGQFLSEARDGSASAGARGAVFMKGRVRDDVEMTLGYDSDRPSDLRQFRDLQLDRGYPVQGDASVRGYDAQSTGRLYARLDRRDLSLLYGDLVTGGSGRSLANYARSLTGAAAAWGSDASGGRAFTSRERSHQAVDELPGRGVSGPYTLLRAPILEGSERVEVLVRDRDQPAIVLSSEAKQRFTDYELDPVSGRLLFRSPVPSFDALLNPVSVRVTYEVPEGTTTAWVHGIQLHQRVGPHLSLGGTYVDDHDPTQPLELRGASATVHLAPRTTLEGEWASTRVPAVGEATPGAGDAGRVELSHEDPATQGRMWAMASAPGFENPGAGLPGGRTEAGGNLVTRLAERTRFKAEALYSADASGRTAHGGLLLGVDHTLSPAWRGELGGRLSGETRAGVASEPLVASVRARMLGQWPAHPEWSGYGEFEQDTQESSRRMAALGGEYRFSARGRAYVRHELASSLDGAWSLSTHEQRLATVAGIDADLAKDAHMFSEYRLSDAMAGRDAQAAVGLRNAWRLANAMRVGFSFERVNPLAGTPVAEGPSTALTGSVDWTEDPVWKGSARMEVRSSRAADQVLQTMAAAVKLDTSWTALGRHALTLGGASTGAGRDAREDLEVALAYRDPGVLPRSTGRWDVLGRWELIYERDPVVELQGRHIANVVGVNSTTRFPHGWSSNLAWAGKLTRDESPSLITAAGAQWLHGRVLLDFASDWDAGVSASLRSARSFADRQYGLGIEIGRQLPANTWLSFGFNRFGYRDDELTGEEWTQTGVFLRIRARFDESLFRHTGGQP